MWVGDVFGGPPDLFKLAHLWKREVDLRLKDLLVAYTSNENEIIFLRKAYPTLQIVKDFFMPHNNFPSL